VIRPGPNKGLQVAVKCINRNNLPREDEEDLLEEVSNRPNPPPPESLRSPEINESGRSAGRPAGRRRRETGSSGLGGEGWGARLGWDGPAGGDREPREWAGEKGGVPHAYQYVQVVGGRGSSGDLQPAKKGGIEGGMEMSGVEADREMTAAFASTSTLASVSNVLGVNFKSYDSVQTRGCMPIRKPKDHPRPLVTVAETGRGTGRKRRGGESFQHLRV